MRRSLPLMSWLWVVLAASAGAVAEAPDTATARITYVTASSVYVDAGTAEGLRPGHRLEIVRDDTVVAVLELKDVTTHRASCRVVESTADPVVGDTVRFVPSAEAPAPFVAPADPGAPSSLTRAPRRADLGIHGRVGVSYIASSNRDTDAGYSQPALDMRLDGRSIAGTPWALAVDVRARRTYRDLSDGTESDEDRTRLYRLAVGRRGISDPWSFTIGRQYSPALAAVSIFDGVTFEYNRPGWSAGLFAGTQPDAEDFGFSDQIREYGVFAGFRGRGSSRHRWQISTAAIGSYDDGEVNREFLYLQGRYGGPRFSLYVAEEIDFNRNWKKDEGEDSVEVTGSFISMRWQATDVVGFHAGFDNRRNIRLYRDFVTPVTEFDDAFRDGIWAGLYVRPAPRFRIGADARTNSGGSAGDSDALNVYLGASGLTRRNVGFDLRSARYGNDRVDGWLHSLGFGVGLGRDVYLQLRGGRRDEDEVEGLPIGETLTWYGVDLDVTLGHHWYLLVAVERSDGDLESDDQLYVTLSYRF